jgi:hypothetical protein
MSKTKILMTPKVIQLSEKYRIILNYLYAIFINCSWVVTRWQYTFTYTKIHRKTQITTNVEDCGPCPVFASFTLAFALQLRKRHGKIPARIRKTFNVI